MRPDDVILGELLKLPAPRPHPRIVHILSLYEEAERMESVGGGSAAEILSSLERQAKDRRPAPALSASFPALATRRAVLDEEGLVGAERKLALALFAVADRVTSEVIEEVAG